MVGWYTHNTFLIQIQPQWAPMQFNTALGFVLSGLGFFCIHRQARTATILFGTLVSLPGFFILIQYLAGIDLKIDQFFMDAYITTKTSNPGRMAPNAAFTFLITGITFLTTALYRFSDKSIAVMACLGALIMGSGFTAFLGYLSGLETIYGWGNLTRMAMHTSILFMTLGFGLVSFAVSGTKRFQDARWGPWAITILLLVITISFWQGLKANETQRLQHQTDTSLPLAILLFGALTAIAVGFSIYLAQFAKSSENRLIDLNKDLKDSKERHNLALEAAHMGIWDLNLVDDSAIRSLRHDQIFGYSPLLPKWGREIFMGHVLPEDQELAKSCFEEAFKTGRLKMKCRIHWADESVHWIFVEGRVFYDHNKKPVRMIGTVVDITEQINLSEIKKQTQEELERFNRLAIGREERMIELKQIRNRSIPS